MSQRYGHTRPGTGILLTLYIMYCVDGHVSSLNDAQQDANNKDDTPFLNVLLGCLSLT
jgi:hypothetical protein